MPENTSSENDPSKKITEFEPGPASKAMISLSQAILAPLDALAKAQVHAARSFLNFLLQMGYPHQVYRGKKQADGDGISYSMKFRVEQDAEDGKGKKIVDLSIPALALVPTQPLGIESAEYNLQFVIHEIDYHRQIQASEEEQLKKEGRAGEDGRKHEPRPWYLVSDPISVRGTLSDPGGDGKARQQASIQVNVKVSRSPTPAGLAKILSAMTQAAGLKEPEESSN
jgi:hypothetical protein